MARWHLTPAAPADIESLTALESRCFRWPWGRLSFEGEFSSGDGGSLVARTASSAGPEEVIAYLFYRFIVDEVHIFRIAVDPEWRRQGIGARLVRECLHTARSRGVNAAVLEVRPSNVEAIELYRKFGFQVVATRPGYYSDSREDALILKLEMKKEDL
ncbi:MAG: ribosomal protein S18-alanine N-acetyltransferase [Hyphomicrobiales bacterium]